MAPSGQRRQCPSRCVQLHLETRDTGRRHGLAGPGHLPTSDVPVGHPLQHRRRHSYSTSRRHLAIRHLLRTTPYHHTPCHDPVSTTNNSLHLDGTPVDLNNALTLLASYSMISRADGLVSVHRLVQTITAGPLLTNPSDGELPTPLSDAITEPGRSRTHQPLTNVDRWPRWKALTPHIVAVASHLSIGHHNTTILHLVGRVATYLEGQGQLVPAITLSADLQRLPADLW